jgi:hypothetical protein
MVAHSIPSESARNASGCAESIKSNPLNLSTSFDVSCHCLPLLFSAGHYTGFVSFLICAMHFIAQVLLWLCEQCRASLRFSIYSTTPQTGRSVPLFRRLPPPLALSPQRPEPFFHSNHLPTRGRLSSAPNRNALPIRDVVVFRLLHCERQLPFANVFSLHAAVGQMYLPQLLPWLKAPSAHKRNDGVPGTSAGAAKIDTKKRRQCWLLFCECFPFFHDDSQRTVERYN